MNGRKAYVIFLIILGFIFIVLSLIATIGADLLTLIVVLVQIFLYANMIYFSLEYLKSPSHQKV